MLWDKKQTGFSMGGILETGLGQLGAARPETTQKTPGKKDGEGAN